MGKRLAIRGHSTRGKEVIELLEMMGGSNIHNLSGNDIHSYHMIKGIKNEICDELRIFSNENIYYFTLEEFLEKYPFKIGDKVIDEADGCPGVVSEMKWDEDVSDMKYFVAFGNGIDFGWYANDSIEFCEETDTVKPDTNKSERTHEDVIFDSIIWHLRNSVNNGKQNLSGGECEDYFREVVKKNNENKMKNVLAELLDHIKMTPKEELEREFEEIKEWSNVGPTVEEFMTFCECVNKKPTYPKTYVECCEVIHSDPNFYIDTHLYSGYLETLYKLIICRNAYWKIAGEEMGLNKPWEPDWDNLSTNHEFIKIDKGCFTYSSRLLVFPTAEVRDTFYENFKDLIEGCKELL